MGFAETEYTFMCKIRYIKKENPAFVLKSNKKPINLKDLHENLAAPLILLYFNCVGHCNHQTVI